MVADLSARNVTINGVNNLRYLQGLAASGVSDETLDAAKSFINSMPNSGVDLEVVTGGNRARVRLPLSEFVGARDLSPLLFSGRQARITESFVDGPVLGFADQLLGRQPDLLKGAEFVREERPTGLAFTANPALAMFYCVMPNFRIVPGRDEFDWNRFAASYLVAYGEIPAHFLMPALHYGIQAFEGAKVYIREDGTLALFRPNDNARRMARSASRLALSPIDENAFVEILKRVARANAHLLPAPGNGAGYLRPLIVGAGADLGVRSPQQIGFGVSCNPVGPYFAGPLGLVVQDTYRRSGSKLTGDVKVGGNYGGSILPALEMAKSQEFELDGKTHHFSEILYTDEEGNFQEAGAANVFFITKDGHIVTPPLNDQILPGNTRSSVITLLREMGYTVDDQRPVNKRALESGDFVGAFATGTAAVVSSITVIRVNKDRAYQDYFFSRDGAPHAIAAKVHDRLTGIQEGRYEDSHGWVVPI